MSGRRFQRRAALAGGYIVCTTTLNIALPYFVDLVRTGLHVQDILWGVVKSGFFGLIVGLVACYPRADGRGRCGGRRRGDDFQRRHFDYSRHRL